MDRRQSLGWMGSLIATVAWAEQGHATTARAVSLHDLVQRSTRVARGTPLENSTRTEDIGGSRHIVTYTRLRIDELLHGAAADPEILVRTLGGRVGDVAEIVNGEADLTIDEACVVFLQSDPDSVELVTAMAQGHYPMAIDTAGVPRLRSA